MERAAKADPRGWAEVSRLRAGGQYAREREGCCGIWCMAHCEQSGERELARDVMGSVVMVLSGGLMKELRLHPAGKGTHEVIRQWSDKATFVS